MGLPTASWRNSMVRLAFTGPGFSSALVPVKPLSSNEMLWGTVGVHRPPPACTAPRGGTQKCSGHKGSGGFHATDGTPQLDKSKYPDLKAAVAYAHAHGLKVNAGGRAGAGVCVCVLRPRGCSRDLCRSLRSRDKLLRPANNLRLMCSGFETCLVGTPGTQGAGIR